MIARTPHRACSIGSTTFATALLAACAMGTSHKARADVSLLSRYSEVRWTHDAYPYNDNNAADWIDAGTFTGPGLWEITLPHGTGHADEVSTTLLAGEFNATYRAAPFSDLSTGKERLIVRFRFLEPKRVTIQFSASASPVTRESPSSRNLEFFLISLGPGAPFFEIFRDGTRTTEPGSLAVWGLQTWAMTIPAGEYEIQAVTDHQDVDTTGGLTTADARLTCTITIGADVCTADFNSDGFVDFFDYDNFVTCFESGACLPGRSADINGDGFADFFDYDDFVTIFETGC